MLLDVNQVSYKLEDKMISHPLNTYKVSQHRSYKWSIGMMFIILVGVLLPRIFEVNINIVVMILKIGL